MPNIFDLFKYEGTLNLKQSDIRLYLENTLYMNPVNRVFLGFYSKHKVNNDNDPNEPFLR